MLSGFFLLVCRQQQVRQNNIHINHYRRKLIDFSTFYNNSSTLFLIDCFHNTNDDNFLSGLRRSSSNGELELEGVHGHRRRLPGLLQRPLHDPEALRDQRRKRPHPRRRYSG